MTRSIPKYLLEKFSRLYSNFRTEEFTFSEAMAVFGCDERYTSILLSKLAKSGWILKRRDDSDKRKKRYRIIELKEIFENFEHYSNEKSHIES